MREQYQRQLAELFEKLERQLPALEGNPCGECKACCTSDGLTSHNVTALEIDYIEDNVGPEKIDEFRVFLKRDGEVPLCPYYDEGCSIYHFRPFSCRVFGHYRRIDTHLPEVCVFRGQEQIFGVGEYRQAVPQGDELIHLSRYYWAHRTQREPIEGTHYQAAGLEDPLSQALEKLHQGDLSAAINQMETEDGDDPFTLYAKGLMLEEAGRPDLACQVLERALQQAPESPDLWHRLGCSLFAVGDHSSSEKAFRQAVGYHPTNGQAWGLLGMHRLMKGDLVESARCLREAVRLLPDNQSFAGRLAQVEAELARLQP